MRIKGIPTTSGEPISLFRTDQELKRHPAYKLAKGGDAEAAARLIDELAGPLVAQVK